MAAEGWTTSRRSSSRCSRRDRPPTTRIAPPRCVPLAEETVAEVAQLYLGNILYAIELAAMSLEASDKREDAAFYRGIGRKLAEAHGRERDAATQDGAT